MGYLMESVNECIMNGYFTELEACKLPTHQHLLLNYMFEKQEIILSKLYNLSFWHGVPEVRCSYSAGGGAPGATWRE